MYHRNGLSSRISDVDREVSIQATAFRRQIDVSGAEQMTIHDITIPMSDSLAVWPGDTPFRFTWTWRKKDGATVNVGQFRLSVHTGSHADAPFHYDDAGVTIDAVGLEPFIGPARVISVPGCLRIRREDVERFDLSGTPRVLFHTGSWTDHTCFPDTIPVMDEDLPEWLSRQGVVLVGLDVPSVDQLDSKTLPVHHALGANGITILESLELSGVPDGVYELIALPMKLVGADGAPVRAILR
jgi:arylformamidase